MNTALKSDDSAICIDTDDWSISMSVPHSMKFAVVTSLLDDTLAKIMEIDGRLVDWGVEIDLPHENEPDSEDSE